MRQLRIFVNGLEAALLTEHARNSYELSYRDGYEGLSISLTLPKRKDPYVFNAFPNFFEGLLPEGIMLENLLRTKKIDRDDYLSQLAAVGSDLVGGITVKEIPKK